MAPQIDSSATPIDYDSILQKFAVLAGPARPEQLIGKTDHDMVWKKAGADDHRLCDRQVMESGKAEMGIFEPQLQRGGKRAWPEKRLKFCCSNHYSSRSKPC
ncbi:MAG: hypothetical protein AAFQ74_01410 [Cyanobacteria bacterium J06623_4]